MLNELAKNDSTLEARFVCDKGFLKQSKGIMDELPFDVIVTTVPSGKLRRYAHFSWWHYIRHASIVLHNGVDCIKIVAGFFASLWLIARFRPDVVFAKGGFVCLPVGYAARILRIPLVIHDSDARPGLTNKLLARHAQAIGVGMPLENYTYKRAITTYVGVPINPHVKPTTRELQEQYRTELGLPLNKEIVVAVGGGLGSVTINNAMLQAAHRFDASQTLLYNVTGVKNYDAAKRASEGVAAYECASFVYSDMYKLLGAADVVVTRASATTLQELAGLRKAVIAVPAKQLGDQQKNAELFAKYDAIMTLQDDDLDRLGDVIHALLRDKHRQKELAKSLHAFARPHAASDMASIIQKVVA